MATVIFRGDAAAVAQVGTLTLTAYDAATTYKITINGKVVSVVGAGGSTTTTAALLLAALQASTFPEFQEITWSAVGAIITATANTAGKSFTAASSVSGGTGTFGAYTAVTANSGPGDLSQITNYSTGALPSASDTLIFENVPSVGITEGLTALAAIQLTQVWFRNWGGDIGLPQHTGSYWEYRQTYMQLKATEVIFDCSNCQLARLDSQTFQTSLKVFSTGTSRVQNLETLCWKGTHASNVAQLDGGSIGIAVLAGETATLATTNCGFVNQPQSDGKVRFGTGVTWTTITRIGGTLELRTGGTTINSKTGSGPLTIYGTGAITTINSFDGGIFYLSSGTITTLTLGATQTFDSTRNEVGFTITNSVVMYSGSSFLDPGKRATMSGGYSPTGCGNKDVIIDRGPNTSCTAT